MDSTALVDTSAFFAKVSDLKKLISERKLRLVTVDFVVFEFVKLMQAELNEASRKKRQERMKMLTSIKDRFPNLLRDLGIEIVPTSFNLDDLDNLYGKQKNITGPFDAGDYMIWLKMKKAGIDSILTENVEDWKKFGAKIVP